MSTARPEVALYLLRYRHRQLGKAIENATKLGFTDGAALYPMVTMNGEECHNEWEITFEEIHRNGAIAFAVYDYTRYTGDTSYLYTDGIEVLAAIARFWAQRANFSADKKQYVILGVTGPNEYENNVNNNWYTNYIAKWCLEYAAGTIAEMKLAHTHAATLAKLGLKPDETEQWVTIASQIYLPYDAARQVYLQNDGFLDKELRPASSLQEHERPINQHWSWDRILRSCFIKQADVIQGMYFFEEHFSEDEIRRNFDFYEPMTVHESSLSPCIYSAVASKIGNTEKAYQLYLRTSRLDLDDYNKEADEGLHITSMAGTWISIVKGFAGMRVSDEGLSFAPALPQHWDSFSFKIIFRGADLFITVRKKDSTIEHCGGSQVPIFAHGRMTILTNGQKCTI
jgi:maltose phosphorylase